MNEEKQSKPKLSQPQLETLVARTGVSEADSRKIFGAYVHICMQESLPCCDADVSFIFQSKCKINFRAMA